MGERGRVREWAECDCTHQLGSDGRKGRDSIAGGVVRGVTTRGLPGAKRVCTALHIHTICLVVKSVKL